MHLVVLPVTSDCNPSTTCQACMHSSNIKSNSSSRNGLADNKSLASMTGSGAKKSLSTTIKERIKKNYSPRAKNEVDEARGRGKLENTKIRVRCLPKKRTLFPCIIN